MSLPLGCVPECRACPHRELDESESLREKENYVRKNLSNYCVNIHPIKSSGARWGYRDRGVLHWACDGEGWKYGLIRDDEIVEIPDCPIHSPELNIAYREISKKLSADFALRFTVKSGSLLTLVLKAKRDLALEKKLKLECEAWLKETLSNVRGVYVSWNPSAGNRVLSAKETFHLCGEEFGVLKFFERLIHHGPTQFLQTRPEMMESIFQLSLNYFRAHTIPNQSGILDLYSGIGLGMDFWIESGFKTLGVELSGEAVEQAKSRGLKILQGKVSDRIPQIEEWISSIELAGVFMNPPRMGLEPEWLDFLSNRIKAGTRSVYLSCNPATLGRDVSALTKNGWRVDEVRPYDFFPQTKHTEVLLFMRN